MRIPLFALLASLLALAACTGPGGYAVSPPAAVMSSPLVGNRWRLEQVQQDGESASFAVAAPVYVEFGPTGYLDFRYDGICFAAGSATVRYAGDQKYNLFFGPGAGVGCDGHASDEQGKAICDNELGAGNSLQQCQELLERQYGTPQRSLGRTNAYELAGNHLILRGDGVEMWFIIDNP